MPALASRLILAAALLFAPCLPASAGSPPDGVKSVTLLPGWREGNIQHAALVIDLEAGWHTYWRVPGEAGIAPELTWIARENVTTSSLLWPTPIVFEVNGMRSIGYEGRVVLPIDLVLADQAAPAALTGTLDIGVCKDICLPYHADLVLDITGDEPKDPLIVAARRDLAKMSQISVTCTAEPISDGMRLRAEIALAPLGEREHIVIETPDPQVWVGGDRTWREGGRLLAEVDLVPPEAKPFALDRSSLRLTLLGGAQALEVQGCSGS